MKRHSSIGPVHVRKSVTVAPADRSKRRPAIVAAIGASLVTAGAAAAYFLQTRPAMATVLTAGPGGAPLTNVAVVSVDGARSRDCQPSGCRVELRKGRHALRAT